MKFDPRLSGLRGLAAFGVMLYHTSYFGLLQFPLLGSLYLGIPVFLMLSIYLLLHRLDSNADLKHYFKRRIIRIWPIYYGCIIAFFLLYHIPFWDFIRYLFFVEYYVNPGGIGPAAIFWTLQLEEAMYLFIPLIHKPKFKLWIGLGFIVVGTAYFIVIFPLLFPGNHQFSYSYLGALPPAQLIAYGFGILAYLGKIGKNLRRMAASALALYMVQNYFPHAPGLNQYLASIALNNYVLYIPLLIGIAAVLSHPPNFLGWFTLLGEESYALYAIHFAFLFSLGFVGIPLSSSQSS